jgi:hypothetical protein
MAHECVTCSEEDPALTVGGFGWWSARPCRGLTGERIPLPLEEAGHRHQEAAEYGTEAEPQSAVDQDQLVSAQLGS